MHAYTNEVSVQFVEICVICGQKTFAAGKRKSALIRQIRVIRAAFVVALAALTPFTVYLEANKICGKLTL